MGTSVRTVGTASDGARCERMYASNARPQTRIAEPKIGGQKLQRELQIIARGEPGRTSQSARLVDAGRCVATRRELDETDGCYACETRCESPAVGSPEARSAHGEVRHRRWRPAFRHDGSGREQERRATHPRGLASDGGRSARAQRPADPRRRGDAEHPQGARRLGPLARCERSLAVRGDGARGRGRGGVRGVDSRFVPARGPAASTLPPRRDVAAEGWCDRPSAPRPTPRRVPRDGRGCQLRARDRAQRAAGPALDRRVHGRAVGDGDGECAARGGAYAGHDSDRQRALRAARAGPRADAREDGRGHPGNRLELDHGQRRGSPARLRAPLSRQTTSRSAASWHSRA